MMAPGSILRLCSAVLLMIAMALFSVGCTTSYRTDPYAPQSEVTRDPLQSQEKVQQAIRVLDEDPSDPKSQQNAELLLREALAFDLYNGQAHNNLGVIYLKQSKLYEAASEFEWARKLMPGHPDPRMNLALTLERAGRVNDAIDMYERALEVYPEHIQTTQALARLQLRSRKPNSRTRNYLQMIAMRGETQQWKTWAQEQMAKQEH